MMLLGDIAHARAGDKGAISQISVIVYDLADFDLVRSVLTVGAVADHVGAFASSRVERYEIAHLGILNFVFHDALSSGVTRSLALDAHGKCLSSVLLTIPLVGDIPALHLDTGAAATVPQLL